MSNNKASGGDIPINILNRSYFTCRKLKDSINHVINTSGKFPDSLKSFNIMPVFKKDETTHKENWIIKCATHIIKGARTINPRPARWIYWQISIYVVMWILESPFNARYFISAAAVMEKWPWKIRFYWDYTYANI